MTKTSCDAELAISLSRLWPNREHEASAVAGLLCRLGIHYWRRLDLTDLAPSRDIRFCFWCSKVEIDWNDLHTLIRRFLFRKLILFTLLLAISGSFLIVHAGK
jgi:hypothetical protein